MEVISNTKCINPVMKCFRGPARSLALKVLGSSSDTAARCPVKTPAVSERNAGASPERATHICDASPSKRPGATGSHQVSDPRCVSENGGVPDEIKELAWKAQHRLHRRYCRLSATRKDQRKIITGLGRELLGFIWAIGIKAETAARQRIAGRRKARAKTKDLSKE